MSKHTPGPWHLSVPKYTGRWAGFNTYKGQCIGVYATNDDLEAVALVPKDELLVHGEQDHKSNAQLIAASPTMYEALSNYKTVMERFFETLPDELVIDLITAAVVQDANDMAKRALAKAEGKEVKND
jgi:hypothetical protein